MEWCHPKQYKLLLSHTSTNYITKTLLSDNTREQSLSVKGKFYFKLLTDRCKVLECVLIHNNTLI